MSARDLVDRNNTNMAFNWVLSQHKIRDGQHGPVFLALRAGTRELITAEKWDLEVPGDSSLRDGIVSHLAKKEMSPSQPNVVSYLGYQLREGHIFVLREHMADGTLQGFIRKHGVLPQPLIRWILHQILLGLQQLQKQGIAVVFLDSANIMMDTKAGVKIEAPLLDRTITGNPLPPTVLTVPEILMSQRNLRKADVWLFGIVAAQLVSGDSSLAGAIDIATQIQQADGPAWEVPISNIRKRSELDKQESDLIRRCFTS